MEIKEFKKFLNEYFRKHGFEKIKNKFYRNGNGFLCEIAVSRSCYGEFYYFDFHFFIGIFEKPYIIDKNSMQTYTPCVYSRFIFNNVQPSLCYYLNYDEEQLSNILDENMNKVIYPPFEVGKKFLLENFETLYFTILDGEKIKNLLSE